MTLHADADLTEQSQQTANSWCAVSKPSTGTSR